MALLEFFYGPMKSGKTLDILRVDYDYRDRGFRTMLIQSGINKERSPRMTSRSGLEREVDLFVYPGTNIEKAIPFKGPNKNIDVILVDEIQFMTVRQMNGFKQIARYHDIPVKCYGLRVDRFGNPWESSAHLLCIADRLMEISTVCHCGKTATMTGSFRNKLFCNDSSEGQFVLDIDRNKIVFIPMCSECHYEYMQEGGVIPR